MKYLRWLYLLRNNFHLLDRDTQKIVYKTYWHFIYRDIIYLTKSHELAEDVVQESFLKVVASAPSLKCTKNFKAWIQKVALNHMYDLLKKTKKYHHVAEPPIVKDKEVPFLHSSVAEQVENKLRNRTLYDAMNELSPTYRKVLLMFYFNEKSQKEIAQELNTTEQAIAQTMVRARKKLYVYFSSKWIDPNY
ncbi:RNA polymerase sigma factor [Paenibacillus sp. 2TAF8]|jgi:RNA polymerase sigma-70 factor (ECF subfamily)|uniref:RNA polymerase sigma factor n=1 Tax=Paenibacillus sp. 2TAF8 TaxID=3233020 RepID=UPI003F97B676